MAKESDFQSKIIKWLRSKKCFVYKMKADATTQRGVADLFFTYQDKHGFLEVKKSAKAPFRAGQKEFLAEHSKFCLAVAVYPENWQEIKREIEEYLKNA